MDDTDSTLVRLRLPKAVLFDFGGTLDADGVPWKARFRRLFPPELDEAAFDRAFYDADDWLVSRIPRETSFEETVTLLAERLVTNLGRQESVDPTAVARRFLSDSQDTLSRNARVLEALSQRARLGVVSNFYGNLSRVCEDTGVARFFQVMVDSVVVGAEKPDPRIFQAALDGLGVSPAEAVFVGDSRPRDMAGARALGMPHVWLSAEVEADGQTCCPDDVVVRRLDELLGVFEWA